MSKRSPTFKQAVLALVDRRLSETCVAIPAAVQSYDISKQTADVQPLVQAYRTVEGVQQAYALPVIPHCPVKWPGAGGYFFACPLQPGDHVLLVFSDRALERWFTSGQGGDPGDPRLHSIKDAFVLPELRHSGRPIAGLSSSRAIIGKEDGPQITFGASDIRLGSDSASEPVMHGSAFKTALDLMLAATQAYVVAAATPSGGAAAALTAWNAAKTAFDASFTSALSSTVKVS